MLGALCLCPTLANRSWWLRQTVWAYRASVACPYRAGCPLKSSNDDAENAVRSQGCCRPSFGMDPLEKWAFRPQRTVRLLTSLQLISSRVLPCFWFLVFLSTRKPPFILLLCLTFSLLRLSCDLMNCWLHILLQTAKYDILSVSKGLWSCVVLKKCMNISSRQKPWLNRE